MNKRLYIFLLLVIAQSMFAQSSIKNSKIENCNKNIIIDPGNVFFSSVDAYYGISNKRINCNKSIPSGDYKRYLKDTQNLAINKFLNYFELNTQLSENGGTYLNIYKDKKQSLQNSCFGCELGLHLSPSIYGIATQDSLISLRFREDADLDLSDCGAKNFFNLENNFVWNYNYINTKNNYLFLPCSDSLKFVLKDVLREQCIISYASADSFISRLLNTIDLNIASSYSLSFTTIFDKDGDFRKLYFTRYEIDTVKDIRILRQDSMKIQGFIDSFNMKTQISDSIFNSINYRAAANARKRVNEIYYFDDHVEDGWKNKEQYYDHLWNNYLTSGLFSTSYNYYVSNAESYQLEINRYKKEILKRKLKGIVFIPYPEVLSSQQRINFRTKKYSCLDIYEIYNDQRLKKMTKEEQEYIRQVKKEWWKIKNNKVAHVKSRPEWNELFTEYQYNDRAGNDDFKFPLMITTPKNIEDFFRQYQNIESELKNLFPKLPIDKMIENLRNMPKLTPPRSIDFNTNMPSKDINDVQNLVIKFSIKKDETGIYSFEFEQFK